MREEEHVRWDVTVPSSGKSRKESKLKTLLSALVLLALLAGPGLVSKERHSAKSGPPASAATQSVAGAGGGADVELASTARPDSAGTHYGRYFPGRQAM